MGIRDRHYFLDASSPKPAAREPSTVRIALFWIAVLAIGFAAFRVIPMLLSPSPGIAPVAPPAARPAAPPVTVAPVVPSAPPPPRASRGTSSSSAPIYRCGNQYGREPCAGARLVDQPAASGFDSRPSERLGRLVAAGRSAGDDGATTVVRTVTTLDEYGRVDASGGDRSRQCASWAADVASIDRVTRQPLSAAQQDWYRDRRQRVRDQQAAMHC